MLAASPFTFAVYTKERTRIRGKIEKLFRRWVQSKQVQQLWHALSCYEVEYP
jgi:hypothetical protein